jgi:hypothetical protein
MNFNATFFFFRPFPRICCFLGWALAAAGAAGFVWNPQHDQLCFSQTFLLKSEVMRPPRTKLAVSKR